jgi:lysophospholipase L1-like esterase
MVKKNHLISFCLIAFCLLHGLNAGAITFKTNTYRHSVFLYKKPTGLPGDKHIKYFGRWDFSNPAQYVSYWGGAYIKTKFSGTTIGLKVGNTSNFYAKIDKGPWVSYLNVGGTVNLTPTKLKDTIHSIIVAQGKDYDYVFNFQGFILDPGAATFQPQVNHNLIEYIGDSITTGYTDSQANVADYAWIAAESLNCEHTQIAYPGINLVSGYKGKAIGMDVQYFKERSLKYLSSAGWNFKGYKPKVIVINLGTNDNANKVPDSAFQKTYVDFLIRIRSKFPKTEILVMRTFLGLKEAPTIAAVNARNAAGDSKVHYINTTGWLTVKSDDYNDGAHPSNSGHIKAAKMLAPILAPYLE